jgi:ATP-binding cassette subfamily B protein RaxB
MRREFPTSTRGTSLRTLINVANQIGLVPRAVRLSIYDFNELRKPAILHWDNNHYVVLERLRKSEALIHDPQGQSRWIPLEKLANHFAGVALELSRGLDFKPQRKLEKLPLSSLWQRMRGFKRAIAQILVLSLFLQVYVLALPYYIQISLDRVIPALDYDLLSALAIGFGLFSAFNAGAAMLRGYIALSAGADISFGITSNLARHLFRLPLEWFEKRSVGDILSRFQSVDPIRRILTEGAVTAFLDGLLSVAILAMMFYYSAALSIIIVSASSIYIAIRWYSFKLQRGALESAIISRGKEQATIIESLRGMQALRLYGQESMRHADWQALLNDVANDEVRLGRIGLLQSLGSALVFGLENVITVWFAVGLILDGAGFSIGMLFAYMAYKVQLSQRVSSLIDNFVALQMLSLHLERIADIALSPEDIGFAEVPNAHLELVGSLELRNVGFRYSGSDLWLFKGLDLEIRKGDHLVITGPSGSGKSTLIKLITGVLEPTEGNIFIDGTPLRSFGHRNLQSQIGVVSQEDSLFAGSLLDNITFFDQEPNIELVEGVVNQASIKSDIMAMPMKLETLVGEMGSTLSGGQRQRVLLARALYRQPKMLIMDEGTAYLDPVCERAVNEAIAGLGITRIVVAHRRETIQNASRRLLLAEGEIRELD